MIYFLWTMIGLYGIAVVIQVCNAVTGNYYTPSPQSRAIGILINIAILIWAITLVT